MVRNRQVQFLGAVALAGLLAGGAWLHATAVYGRVQQMKQLRAELDDSRSAVDITKLRAEVSSMNDRIEAVSSLQVSDTIHSLTRLLADLGVSDRSITTSAPDVQGVYQLTPVNVAFRGSLQAAFELTKTLGEDHRHVTCPQRIEIVQPADSPSGALDVKLQLKVVTRSPS